MTPLPVFVGIDVAKDRLDLAWRPTGERWAAPNTERGIRSIYRRLRTPAPALIVLEATGGLELPLTGALAAAGVAPLNRDSGRFRAAVACGVDAPTSGRPCIWGP